MIDSDGVRVENRRRWWLVVVALGVAAVIALVIMMRRGDESTSTPPPQEPRATVPTPAPTVARMRLIAAARVASPSPQGDTATPTAAISDAPTPLPKDPRPQPVAQSETPAADAEMAPTPPPSDYGWKGETGIALFPPPGTNPPKPGIIVPDEFELPQGYVRYHQTTDDGKDLAPILAFHPDYQFVDENGQPVQLPQDLIVTPELAPPGIPIEILKVPETIYPQGPSQEEVDKLLNEHPELLQDGLSPEEAERIIREHQDLRTGGGK